MLISVTAPCKGMGQSVTTINLAVMISRLIRAKTLIIDINDFYRDIAYYLSNSICTKGLDDFKSLVDANMINSKTAFNSCVKNVHENIDIMDSNESCDFGHDEISNLVTYTSMYYPVTLVDTISGRNNFSKEFFEKSDAIIVVINQTTNSISKIFQDNFYKEYLDKVFFIVNKCMSSYDKKKVRYTIKDIERDLKKHEVVKDKIFELCFDVDLVNEYNEKTILNYLLNNSQSEEKYIKQLEYASRQLLEQFGNIHINGLSALTRQDRKSLFKSFFNIKQRRNLNAKYE